MPTCSRQTLVKDHAFLVKPAYYLKSLYGVRGFCVCDISVVIQTRNMYNKMNFFFWKGQSLQISLQKALYLLDYARDMCFADNYSKLLDDIKTCISKSLELNPSPENEALMRMISLIKLKESDYEKVKQEIKEFIDTHVKKGQYCMVKLYRSIILMNYVLYIGRLTLR